MIENSVENFINDWQSLATGVTLYPSPEGSPLLEVSLPNNEVIYLLDRCGPYVAKPGLIDLIINPVTNSLQINEGRERILSVGISRIKARGTVLKIKANLVAIQAEIPLIVGVFDDSWRNIEIGASVFFESLAPIHGFVVKNSRKNQTEPVKIS